MKNGWGRKGLLFIAVMALSVNIGCSSSGGSSGDPDTVGSGDIPEEWIEACRDLIEAFCEKYVECDPVMAEWIFGVTDASQCAAAVATECTDDGTDDPYDYDDDGCEPETYPTEAQHQACLSEVQNATCDEFENIEEEGACAEYYAILECEDDEGDDDDSDAGVDNDLTTTPDLTIDAESDGSVGQDPVDEVTVDIVPDAPPVEINTAGCEAAVAASCTALATCAGQITIPPGAIQDLVNEVVGNCADRVTNGADNIAQACEDYLTEGVTTGQPNAIWLNDATPTEVQECVADQDCDLSFLAALAGGVADFFDDPSATNLGALLAPLLSGCGAE